MDPSLAPRADDGPEVVRQLGRITHGLKGQLTVVMGYAEMLADRSFGEIAPQKVVFAQKIHGAGGRMLMQLSNIVHYTRVETSDENYRMAPFDLAPVVADLAAVFGPMARSAGVTLQVPEVHGVRLEGDLPRIRLVFQNLLDNAVRHTTAGGAVRLSTWFEGDRVGFEVRDEGRGISPASQGLLFQKFGRLPESEAGIGLGLFVVRTILEAHGSKPVLESDLGQGTAIRFLLPAAAEAPANGEIISPAQWVRVPVPAPVRAPVEASSGRPRLLLVGRHPDVDEARKALRAMGYPLFTSESAMECLQVAAHDGPRAIIMHESVPDLPIGDLCYALGDDPHLDGIPRLLLSREPVESVEGVDDVISLPLSREAVEAVLSRLLVD